MKQRRAIVLVGVGLVAAGLMGKAGTRHGLLLRGAFAAPAAYDWLQFGFDAEHSGNNTRETTVTPANVGKLHRLFRVSLPAAADSFMAVADGVPAYLSAVPTAAGVRDLLFLTTRGGTLVALDAHTGEQVWVKEHPYGRPERNPSYTKSSPAIDPNRQYVYSYGLGGYVHRHRVADGSEVTGGGWPEVATLKPSTEYVSSALSIATDRSGASYLYVTHAKPGDVGDYQGHITAINLADGSQHVFNALSSDQAVHFVEQPGTPDAAAAEAGIWARAGVVYDPDTDRIYVATGNGPYQPSRHNWSNSVLALHPDGTGLNGDPLDSYAPVALLEPNDSDLGSTAPAILPAPAGSAVRHLAVQGGKDGFLRLLNLDNLSGQGGPGHTGGEIGTPMLFPQPSPHGKEVGEMLSAPAVWVNPADQSTWAFVTGTSVPQENFGAIAGLRLSIDPTGTPSLKPIWDNNAGSVTSPIIANGVLFYATITTGQWDTGASSIHALDPTTGTELWSDTTIVGIHMESPIVCNGVLYITDGSHQVTAYAPS